MALTNRLHKVAFLALLVGWTSISQAQTFNFTSGTNSWNVNGSWTPAGFPNAIGASATFNSPTATQTTNLSAAITVGSLTLTNNNTGTITHTLANGTGGSLTMDATSGNASITVNGTSTTTNNIAFSASITLNDTLDFTLNNSATGTSASATFTGALSGVGGFRKLGDGTLTMSTTAKTYSGATEVLAGILRYTATGAANATSSVTVSNGGQLRFDSSSGAFSFGGGTALITINGTGTSGSVVSTGALRNQASGASTLANPVSVATNAGIHVDGSTASLQLNGVFSGSGLVTKTGAGNLILNNTNNSHTGGYRIFNGTVTANANSPIGGPVTLAQTTGNNTGFTINSNQTIGALQANFNDTTGTQSQTVTINGASTVLTVNQSTNTTFGNGAVSTLTSTITGAGALTKSGNGNLTLAGANTYTGQTTVGGGTLTLGLNGALPTTSNVTLSGGSLALASGTTNTTSGTLTLSSDSTIDFGSPGATTSLSFANSSGVSWSGILIITGWNGSQAGGGTSRLFVGSNSTGLLAGQLANINFAGFDPGAVILNTGELVPVPEPATLLGLAAVAGLAIRRIRRA